MFYLFLSIILVVEAYSQGSSSIPTSSISPSLLAAGGDTIPFGSSISYLSYSSTITLPSTTGTAPATPLPSALQSTQVCNLSPSLCSRSYCNITYIGAHNSPFAFPNNIASNQDYGVLTQLNAGIRMLQGQTHVVNDTVYFCHTSCGLLNAGTAESYFANVTAWLAANPYDVITVLIVNGDLVDVSNFTEPLETSGLAKYAYIPDVVPMVLGDWPTLEQLISSNQRAVIFVDYNANQTAVPYILDEFSQLWETPFDPTDTSFPCTVQRPTGLSNAQAEARLYMANHNLDSALTVLNETILIPDIADLNATNAVAGYGSLGLAASNCAGKSSYSQPSNNSVVGAFHANIPRSNMGPSPQFPARRLLQRRQRLRLPGRE